MGGIGADFSENGTLIEHWDGSVWSIVPSPDPPDHPDAILLGIGCVLPADCYAVGRSSDGGFDAWTLVERWDGDDWTIPAVPAPVPSFNGLVSVSCTPGAWCMLVGDHRLPSDRVVPLAERWNGSDWDRQRPPVPYGSSEAQLIDVSCPAAGNCIAVGSSYARTGEITLAERYLK